MSLWNPAGGAEEVEGAGGGTEEVEAADGRVEAAVRLFKTYVLKMAMLVLGRASAVFR